MKTKGVNKVYREPVLNDPNKPLVSLLIFNYDYGRYLMQCFDSVFAQTYDNIEIDFSDNASTDDSWDIAVEYARKYPGMMTLTCNRSNFGIDANVANCNLNARGKYYILLCSDDALMPEYVEQCVHELEAHPNAGFAMVHRMIIDEHGRSTEELPFYNQSCIIPGAEQAAMYMMEEVNPCVSQVMYRKNMTYGKSQTERYNPRILDFNMCCEFPMVYIKEPLLMHRLHTHSHDDSFNVGENLFEVIVPYVLQYQFAEVASHYNLDKVVDRLPQSLVKLGEQCLLYCGRSLNENDEQLALRYFHLAVAINPDIIDDTKFKILKEYWASDTSEKLKIVESLGPADNLTTRSISYDPPPGSILLDVKILEPLVVS